jgi:hypothetical protein
MKVTQDNLLVTVQRLADEEEIRRVLFDYANFLDLNETSSLVKLFTEDCHIAYGQNHGADGIAAYQQTLEDEKFGVGAFFAGTSHHVSNVVVDFTDEDTTTSWSEPTTAGRSSGVSSRGWAPWRTTPRAMR